MHAEARALAGATALAHCVHPAELGLVQTRHARAAVASPARHARLAPAPAADPGGAGGLKVTSWGGAADLAALAALATLGEAPLERGAPVRFDFALAPATAVVAAAAAVAAA
eukprot:CAMPEP_0119492854 /NCGR_PEP_ID=MMETSP1344-20130328/17275_1 /TAXON_ID=236787 /ORGANISM="Florenciella parvula, Strain CCMP2471" /LENGTH=111 /DNA_ID=CAMNT_0007528229 /DNA_START=71 /DNA_END=404 /DNA_ORIENTATION=+